MAAADEEGRGHQHYSHHFLVVAHGTQSHVNPGRVLAHRLTRLGVDGSTLATLSVPVVAYRRMFPSLGAAATTETTDGVISYILHSDGLDDGSSPTDAEDRARRRRASSDSLSAVVARLSSRGQPVTCIMCTMVSLPVLDVARKHSIPLVVYWLQPTTVLAASYHYFHGYDKLIAPNAMDEVCVPGLCRPVQISNLPSFLTETSGLERDKALTQMFRELFEFMDQWRPKVLVNSFAELEANVLAEMKRHLDVVTVGPMVGSSTDSRIHLFKHDDVDKKRYMEWLQAHPDKSVVYVSFGSVTKFSKQQMDEIAGGLRQCARPYLLAVRRDGESSHGLDSENTQISQGMVVDWCDQLEVLSHPAVGCFVSHCGWNSTIEAMVSGVPIVGVPNTFDQPTNSYLVEEEWEIGIKGERNGDGVLTGAELARCIELVMGDGARAVAIRERAKALKEIAQAAASTGGSAEINLSEFVKTAPAREQFAGFIFNQTKLAGSQDTDPLIQVHS